MDSIGDESHMIFVLWDSSAMVMSEAKDDSSKCSSSMAMQNDKPISINGGSAPRVDGRAKLDYQTRLQ